MTFRRFIKACEIYEFSFILNACGTKAIILKPSGSFDDIEIKKEYNENFNKLFVKSIKMMKMYRKERGYYGLPRCSSDG